MMNVCLVSGQFPPDAQGGAENYILRTAKELLKRGHNAFVLTTQPYTGQESFTPTRGEYEGIPVWRFFPLNISHLSEGTGESILKKGLWHAIDSANPHSAFVLRRFLRKRDLDVVHTNNLTGISPAIVTQIPDSLRHVHTLHDYSLICPKGNLLREMTASGDEPEVCEEPPAPCRAVAREKRALVGSPDFVTGPSQHVIDVHINHGFFNESETRRIRLGVEPDRETPPEPPDKPAVLYAGNLQKQKGLDVLLDAANDCTGVTFHVCGAGPYEDIIRERAERMDTVQIHGFVTLEQLTELREKSSAAIVPSIWMENSPMTIYESYGTGLPVIGSDIGGIPELIIEGETGYLVPPRDSSALADQIMEIAENPDEQGYFRREALNWASEHRIGDHVNELLEYAYQQY